MTPPDSSACPAPSADEQALLAAVIAHPDEDTPRLIYADWLDEHAGALAGRDPKEMCARAEFIRAQIEVVRRPADSPALNALQTRLEHLDLWYASGWWGPGTKVLVRGFPVALRVDYLSDLCGPAEHWLSKHPIQFVYANEAYLRNTEEEGAVCLSPHFARFTGLGSSSRGWDGDRVAKILTNPHLKNLRVLDLFCGSYNGPEGAQGIAAATHLTNLLTLDLGGNKIGDEGLAALAGAEQLASLRSLCLGEDYGGVANEITEEGIKTLARSRCLTALTQLALDGNEVGTDGIEHILNAEWVSNLTELNLFHAWIGEAGLLAIARSGRLANLRRLDVSANGVTEAVAHAFLHSEALPNLVDLRLISFHELEEPLTEATQVALRKRFGPGVMSDAIFRSSATCVEDSIRWRLHDNT